MRGGGVDRVGAVVSTGGSIFPFRIWVEVRLLQVGMKSEEANHSSSYAGASRKFAIPRFHPPNHSHGHLMPFSTNGDLLLTGCRYLYLYVLVLGLGHAYAIAQIPAPAPALALALAQGPAKAQTQAQAQAQAEKNLAIVLHGPRDPGQQRKLPACRWRCNHGYHQTLLLPQRNCATRARMTFQYQVRRFLR